jgi:hypothetical protein
VHTISGSYSYTLARAMTSTNVRNPWVPKLPCTATANLADADFHVTLPREKPDRSGTWPICRYIHPEGPVNCRVVNVLLPACGKGKFSAGNGASGFFTRTRNGRLKVSAREKEHPRARRQPECKILPIGAHVRRQARGKPESEVSSMILPVQITQKRPAHERHRAGNYRSRSEARNLQTDHKLPSVSGCARPSPSEGLQFQCPHRSYCSRRRDRRQSGSDATHAGTRYCQERHPSRRRSIRSANISGCNTCSLRRSAPPAAGSRASSPGGGETHEPTPRPRDSFFRRKIMALWRHRMGGSSISMRTASSMPVSRV